MSRPAYLPPDVPPVNTAGTLPSGGPALLQAVAELQARVAELERVQLCGDADRPLSLRETAARIGPGKSEHALRGWMKRAETRRRYRLDMLLRKDPSGRYFSTPRLLQQWTDLLARDARQSIYRRCSSRAGQLPNRPTLAALPASGDGNRSGLHKGTASAGASGGDREDV